MHPSLTIYDKRAYVRLLCQKLDCTYLYKEALLFKLAKFWSTRLVVAGVLRV
jgi:hypothetical protein